MGQPCSLVAWTPRSHDATLLWLRRQPSTSCVRVVCGRVSHLKNRWPFSLSLLGWVPHDQAACTLLLSDVLKGVGLVQDSTAAATPAAPGSAPTRL